MPPSRSTTPVRAALYVRISKDTAGQSLGVQRQETECRELIARQGWTVADVYVDNDLSASTGKPRPSYLRMLEDIKAGGVNAVVAWHTDRLTRRPQELEHLIELADEHSVVFSTVKAGELDLSTSTGQFVARLLGAAARHEAMLKGERQASKARQRAHSGLRTGGGLRPFGYESGGMVIRRSEAQVIRDLASRAIAGETVFGLAQWLADQEIPTVTGRPWSQTVLRNLLTNPRLAGQATYKGQVIGTGQWEPILDIDTSRRLIQVLASRHRKPTSRVSVLAGVVYCGVCGFELVTWQRGTKAEGVRSYGCRTRFMPGRPGHRRSCARISVKAEPIEDDVTERVMSEVLSPRNKRKVDAAVTRKLQDGDGADPTAVELVDVEQRLRDLGRDYADSLLGRIEFLAARDRLQERIQRLERDVGTPILNVPSTNLETLVAWWARAPHAQKQLLVRSRIDRVDVGPHAGRRSDYDPTRVTITWR